MEPALPDLVIRGVLCDEENNLIGYGITNIGDGVALAGHDSLLQVDGERVARDRVNLELAPGETVERWFTGYQWDGTEATVEVCADSYNDLTESNEDNNCTTDVCVAIRPVDLPDLTIRGPVCDEENHLISYGITNIGDGVALAGHVSMLSVNGEEVARHVIGVDISPGETLERWFRGYDWRGTAIEVRVCADFYDKVSESDEDNNCAIGECVAAAPSALPVVIRPDSQRANPGETFPVFIWIDPSHYGVSGGSVTMSFSAGAMQVEEVAAGDLLGTEAIMAPGFPKIDNENGILEIDLARTGSTPVPTAPGALAKITLTAREYASEGTYDLLITEVELSDENYNSIPGIAKEDGTVRIAETRYSRSNVDTNQDGEVDFKDLAIVGGAYGLSEEEAGFDTGADFNDDGLIDYKDLAILGALYGEPSAPAEPATCGLPDLEVTLHSESTCVKGEYVSFFLYVEGDEVRETVEITVHNKGTVAVAGSLNAEPGEAYYIVDLILDKDLNVPVALGTVPSPYVFEEDMLLQGGRLSNTKTLAPGESRTYSVAAPPFDITGKIPPGASPYVDLCAVVDPDNWIDECNEDNNISCCHLKVEPEPPPLTHDGTVKLTYIKTFLPPEEPTEPLFESEHWLSIVTALPRELEQATFLQTVEDLSVTYSIPPSQTEVVSDEYGNTYEVAWWDEEQDTEVSATLEAIIYREMEEEPVSTSDPYPILADEIPDDVKLYLEPCPFIQSDDPAILAVAQPLSQGLTNEVDVVNNTLEWCSQNLGWICPQTVENYQSDAVWTLENGGGNCVNFGNVTVALLRAQGIPARLAYG